MGKSEAIDKEMEYNELVLDSISEGLMTVDHDLKIVNVNKAFIDAHGLPLEDVIGMHCYKISHNSDEPCSSEKHLCPIQQVMETGEKSTTTHTHFDKDGNVIYVELNAYPVRDDKGNVIQFIEISKDITDIQLAREKLEETFAELEEAYEELSSLDELKSHILSNVSHELKTPITIARTSIDLAMDEEDEKKRVDLLKMGYIALTRQNRIISNLIEISNDQKSITIHNRERINVSDILRIVVGEIKPLIKEKNIELILDVPEIEIEGDFSKMKLALSNLLENSVKFNVSNGKIDITAQDHDGHVEIRIKDSGIGIPEDSIDRIFDRLYQVDPTATRKYNGTGMGLAVAKDIIEAHRGKIRVVSKKGECTSYYISLPRPVNKNDYTIRNKDEVTKLQKV